jgi:two-component system response regulator ChvI
MAEMTAEGAPGEEATGVRTSGESVEGLGVRTVGLSFEAPRKQMGEWVMSQFDARAGRGCSSVGVLDRLPTLPAPSEWYGSFNRRKSDRVSPSRPVVPTANAEVRRVVLVESDQYYRELLTFELLCQGFVVHAFADGASLLGSLGTAVDADVAVLDWDLPTMPGTELLAQLRQHGVSLPVVFLTGKFVRDSEHERCSLAPQEALDAYECMAFDQGAVDFIPKSRNREVLVRRLRNVVELVKPMVNAALDERLACDRLQLKPETSRAFWNGLDVDLTLGEYKLVHLLASKAGSFVTYRSLYDRLHFQGFIAGSGTDGFRVNVRSAIKRIRNKFRACDPTFDAIENYSGFGYGWRKLD